MTFLLFLCVFLVFTFCGCIFCEKERRFFLFSSSLFVFVDAFRQRQNLGILCLRHEDFGHWSIVLRMVLNLNIVDFKFSNFKSRTIIIDCIIGVPVVHLNLPYFTSFIVNNNSTEKFHCRINIPIT